MLFAELDSVRHVENAQALFFGIFLVVTIVVAAITGYIKKKDPLQGLYVGASIVIMMVIALVIALPLFL